MLATRTESKLQAVEMRVLRAIKGPTLKDRIRNTTIRAELHVTPLLEEIERIRLSWYGHLMRMEEERRPKRYLMWKPEGKRALGWPRERRIEGVKVALNKRGTSLQEVKNFKRFLRGSPTDRQ